MSSETVASSLLVIGHPGHELRLFGWLEQAHAEVHVLTDGSGQGGESRITHTRACLEGVGALEAPGLAPASDAAWYAALLEGDPQPFVEAGLAVLAAVRRTGCRLIVSDSLDGYNPMHDVAFGLSAAVCASLAQVGHRVRHLAFSPNKALLAAPVAEEIRLDAGALARKEAAFQAYLPLQGEISSLLAEPDFDLATERLCEAGDPPGPEWVPEYESVGRARVSTGRYRHVIESERHVQPMLRAAQARIACAVAKMASEAAAR